MPINWEEKRKIVVPGDHRVTLMFCVENFLHLGREAIEHHGAFFVALSGGSTPAAIYALLASPPFAEKLDWTKVHLFWSDERSVPPEHPDSNYGMAMRSGFAKLPIPEKQIHRMVAEKDIVQNAERYEETIHRELQKHPFDLIILGLGEEGHTASLFPHTEGMKEKTKWVIAHLVPQKNTWRMTMTFPCLNAAKHTVIYVLGASKKHLLSEVLHAKEDLFPVQHVGTKEHPALWIADDAALPPI